MSRIAFELLTWVFCIYASTVLLACQHVGFASVLSLIVIAIFVASFRGRDLLIGMLPGCLGIQLLLWNTGALCVSAARLLKWAGYGQYYQILAGIGGVIIVVIYVVVLGKILDCLFGPISSPQGSSQE